MKAEALILEQLRAAIACVFAGMPNAALEHIAIAERELTIAARHLVDSEPTHVERGLRELAQATPVIPRTRSRVVAWDTSDVDVGGES